MDAFFGWCSDGHLHPIKNEYVDMAKNQKSHFKTSMFATGPVQEETVPDKCFIPLPPTNCPSLADHLPFGRITSRKNRLPNEPALQPFGGYSVHERRTAIEFLIKFEENAERQSETKEQGKTKLFDLIVGGYPALRSVDLDELSYENLREMFLRKFWNIEDQQRIHREFLNAKYPSYEDQRVSGFVHYWLHRFTFCTAFLTRHIVRALAQRIPPQFNEALKKFYNGAKWYMVYEKVLEYEDEHGLSIEGTASRSGWLASARPFDDTYLYTSVIATSAFIIGMGVYLVYYGYSRK